MPRRKKPSAYESYANEDDEEVTLVLQESNEIISGYEENEGELDPHFLPQDQQDARLQSFSENDDFLLSNIEPRFLRSGDANIGDEYVAAPEIEENDILGNLDPAIHTNSCPLSGGYLRDSQETERLDLLEVTPENEKGLFVTAYGEYNPSYSAYGETNENETDGVLGGDFFPGINPDACTLPDIPNQNFFGDLEERSVPVGPTVEKDPGEITKTNNDISLMGMGPRRRWGGRCGCPTNWNLHFQSILGLDDSTEEKCIEKYRKLSALSADFVHTAKNFGKIIISERSLNNDHRTLTPHPKVGGIAGGEKYVYHGILFKFATDWENIFGSDESAMKAAGHELKGVMRYAQCEGLHVPLVAIIDYRGYRLVAESILPLHSKSLLYGSNDGGKTVYAKDEKLNDLMENAGKQLNIKPHYGGITEESREFIYGPTDIEGHLGEDERYYVIDFARVFPPTAERGVSKTFLYKLFRPEFVKLYEKPLSSDGFSKFGRHNQKEHNEELQVATRYLLNDVIPKFANELCDMFPCVAPCVPGSNSLDQFVEIRDITEIIHRAGINVRYLGVIRSHTKEYLKPTILNEMCSRAIKNRLRSVLRKVSMEIKHPQEDKFRQEAIYFLNLVLGHDTKQRSAIEFWCKTIKEDIVYSFGPSALTDYEKDENFDLRDHIVIFRLFKRVQQLTGVVLTKQAQKDLREHPESFEIVQPDINKVSVKVKHMNIISLAEAKALAIASMKQNRTSERLFRLACSKFEIAIQATPDNFPTMNTYADFLVDYAIRNPDRNDNMTLFNRAFEKYKTTRAYNKIFKLTTKLQEIPYFGVDRDDVVIRCFDSICDGIDSEDALRCDSLLGWGKILIARARRLNSIDSYDNAGSKFRLALQVPNLRKAYHGIRDLAEKFSNVELSMVFEIHQKSPQLRCFDSKWCYNVELIDWKPLCTLVSKFRLKQLRLANCDHLTPLNINQVIKEAPYYSFVELDLSNNSMVNDHCLHTIREFCKDSLTSLNISGCTKISSRGFGHLESCTELRQLNISNCLETKKLIGSFSLCFSHIQSFNMANCEFVPTRTEAISGLHDCYSLEELCLSGVPVSNITNLSSFPKLRILDLSHCQVKTLHPLVQKQTKIEELYLFKNKVLDCNSLQELAAVCPNLRKLDIRGCHRITDQQLKSIISTCPQITHLSITKAEHITSDSVRAILQLKSLEELVISHIPIEEILAEGVDLPNLKSLSLFDAGLTKSISQLASCSQLQELNLSRNKDICEESLRDILMNCRKIERLDVASCIRLTDTTIESIGEHLRSLEYLNISNCQLYSNLNSLSNCKILATLVVEDCKLVKEMNELLHKVCLVEINVKGCTMLGDKFLDAVLGCQSLKKISFAGNKISKKTVETFLENAKDIRPSLIINSGTSLPRGGSTVGLANRIASHSLRETR